MRFRPVRIGVSPEDGAEVLWPVWIGVILMEGLGFCSALIGVNRIDVFGFVLVLFSVELCVIVLVGTKQACTSVFCAMISRA